MLKDKVLHVLESERPRVVSGQTLADQFGVSRNAIWKVINQLKEEGHLVVSDGNKGYRLEPDSDVLSEAGIRCYFNENSPMKVSVYDVIDSTNNEAKRRLAAGDHSSALIVADSQEAGRGRLGHDFFSPKGTGIYMTIGGPLSRPLYHAERITLAAAVAVVRVLQPLLPEELKLKWVNDIFYQGKKVCGILSEGMTDLETGLIQHVNVGIGINIRPMQFPEELADIAGSLNLLKPTRNEIAARIANEALQLSRDFESNEYLDEYLAHAIDPDQVRKKINLT